MRNMFKVDAILVFLMSTLHISYTFSSVSIADVEKIAGLLDNRETTSELELRKKYWFVKKFDNNVLCCAQSASTILM